MILVFESAAERRNFIRDCEHISRLAGSECIDCALEYICNRHRLYIRSQLERHTDFDVQLVNE